MLFVPQIHISVCSLYKTEGQVSLPGTLLWVPLMLSCDLRGLPWAGTEGAQEKGVIQGDTLSVNTLINCERGEGTGAK